MGSQDQHRDRTHEATGHGVPAGGTAAGDGSATASKAADAAREEGEA
ncbi:hypothetical protein ACWGB8_10985 [Kitasatospora sp. NPDC054939]